MHECAVTVPDRDESTRAVMSQHAPGSKSTGWLHCPARHHSTMYLMTAAAAAGWEPPHVSLHKSGRGLKLRLPAPDESSRASSRTQTQPCKGTVTTGRQRLDKPVYCKLLVKYVCTACTLNVFGRVSMCCT